MTRQRVVVVTGGGAGIGAAAAESIGRTGAHVVTVDPLLSLDGTEQLPPPEETTAGRIVAAGGSAEATPISVTDGDAVRSLFESLVAERGGLDAVVNVAGITRPTGFAAGGPDEWRSVLQVHLDGYLNVLGAALPLMEAAGHGHVVGVTSGSGWRAANAGAYSCAKRAVAALTWQLGRVAPDGVVIKAMSPIAVTRMVTAALERAQKAGAGSSATGGLALGSMPQPEEIGPFGAYLASDDSSWCGGRILFAGGQEVALVEEPRLLELVRTDGVAALAGVLDIVVPTWGAVEAAQASSGGGNPRFPGVFAETAAPAGDVGGTCYVDGDAPDVVAALRARGVRVADAFDDAVDAVVVAAPGAAPAASGSWRGVLAEHDGIVEAIHADAMWARSVADAGRPMRLVTLTDATTAGGRSRAQAAAQLARSARGATKDRVSAFSIAVEASDRGAAAGLAAHLVIHASAPDLSGAELVAGDGWVGVRSHPRPVGAITYGGPELPAWFDGALRAAVGGR